MDSSGPGPSWTFLTNHARVLIMIARDPAIRLRDVAALCGVTERTVQAIVADLEADGYLTHTREGRRNRYVIAPGTRFRHAAEAFRIEVEELRAFAVARLRGLPASLGSAQYVRSMLLERLKDRARAEAEHAAVPEVPAGAD